MIFTQNVQQPKHSSVGRCTIVPRAGSQGSIIVFVSNAPTQKFQELITFPIWDDDIILTHSCERLESVTSFYSHAFPYKENGI